MIRITTTAFLALAFMPSFAASGNREAVTIPKDKIDELIIRYEQIKEMPEYAQKPETVEGIERLISELKNLKKEDPATLSLRQPTPEDLLMRIEEFCSSPDCKQLPKEQRQKIDEACSRLKGMRSFGENSSRGRRKVSIPAASGVEVTNMTFIPRSSSFGLGGAR